MLRRAFEILLAFFRREFTPCRIIWQLLDFIAEAWFNQLASGIGQADSCGTMPANAIDPRAIQVMSEVGIHLRGKRPKGVTQQTLASQSDRADRQSWVGTPPPTCQSRSLNL